MDISNELNETQNRFIEEVIKVKVIMQNCEFSPYS